MKEATLAMRIYLYLALGLLGFVLVLVTIDNVSTTDCKELQTEMAIAARVQSPEYMDLYRQWRDDCKPPTGED